MLWLCWKMETGWQCPASRPADGALCPLSAISPSRGGFRQAGHLSLLLFKAGLCCWPPAPSSCKSFAFPGALVKTYTTLFHFLVLISLWEGEGLPHSHCLRNKSLLWICTWGGRNWFPLPASSEQIFEGNCSVRVHFTCLKTIKSAFISYVFEVWTV